MNGLLCRNAFAAWVSGPRSSDAGDGMVIDADGSVFIPGSHGGLDLNRIGTIDIQADGIDAFFMKLEPTGAVEWIRSPSGPQFEADSRMALHSRRHLRDRRAVRHRDLRRSGAHRDGSGGFISGSL